jgi:ectoine hydroxylase-related dioxygenase (phytanoyl-CoA dioxygenase family)
VAQPLVLPLIVQLLGPNIHLLSSQLIYLDSLPPDAARTIRTPERTGWHRDLFGSASDLGHDQVPLLAVKCGYYLTDVSQPDAGMTLFAPGSHLLKDRLDIPVGDIDPVGAVQLALRPGDVVLFENRTWHAGGINSSGRMRKCVMIQYGYRWLKPVDYVAQDPELLRTCTDIESQLLGGTEDRDEAGRITVGSGAAPLRAWCDQHLTRA